MGARPIVTSLPEASQAYLYPPAEHATPSGAIHETFTHRTAIALSSPLPAKTGAPG